MKGQLMGDVMAAHAWRTNAEMLADLFRVMPPPKGRWVDLTYGLGRWWQTPNLPPDGLVRCVGPDTATPPVEHVRCDFRDTPFPANTFAVTCFDPPYVLKGGRGKFDQMNDDYGIGHAFKPSRRNVRTRPLIDPNVRGVFSEWIGQMVGLAEMVAGWPLAPDWAFSIEPVDYEEGFNAFLTFAGDRYRPPERWKICDPLGKWGGTSLHRYRPRDASVSGPDFGWDSIYGADKDLWSAFEAVGALRPENRREQLEGLIADGFAEAVRITRPGGWILVKAGRGISGGKLVATDDLTVRLGHAHGLRQVTSLWLVTGAPRSQAHRGPQKTPRANLSRLIVYEMLA